MKINRLLVLFLLVLLGLFLRLRWCPNFVTFGYEQARDAFAATKIFTEKDFTLLGPTTEVEGLFHGPIYYYLIGSVYHIFGPNPTSVIYLHLLFNLATIPIIWWVGKELFDWKVGAIAAFVFTISFEVISYSLWLSNPSPALPFIILAYYFFYRAFGGKQQYLPLASLMLAISVSFDMIIIVHLLGAIALYFIYNKKKIPFKALALSLASFLLPLINYPIFEIRNKFLMTKNFLRLFVSQNPQLKSVFDYLTVYFNGLSREFSNILFPIHGFFAGLLMLGLFFYLYQKIKSTPPAKSPWALILVMLLTNLPTFLIIAAVTNSEFSYFGVNAAAALLFAVFIKELIAKRKNAFATILLFLTLVGNLVAWQNYLPEAQRKLFDSQRGVILKDNLEAIDYTYQQAKGDDFFVDTVTVPLFTNTLWDYLYQWYGKEKYGYLPKEKPDTKIQYLLIEPGWGQTYEYFTLTARENLNKTTTISKTEKFGQITVERRLLDDTHK